MNVRCIKCNESGSVSVDVDTGEIWCGACSECYAVEDVREAVEGWIRLIPWIQAHPGRVPACTPAREEVAKEGPRGY